MKTVMENKLSMYETTIEVMDNNSAQVATIAALVAAKSDLVNKTVAIRAANTVQQKTTKGKTMDKADRKTLLADTAHAIAGSVQAYAAENGNNDLCMLVNFSRTQLLQADDEQIQQLCQLIHDEANAIVLDLADYGVDATKLTDLQGLIDAWHTQSQSPRVAISTRVAATSSLPDLFAAADDILKKRMDKLMDQFYLSDRTFYDTYKAARKIVNAGHGSSGGVGSDSVRLTGNVTDSVTLEPIAGATLTLTSTDNPTPITATTDANGMFVMEFSDVPTDTAFGGTLEASALDHEAVSKPVSVMAGNAYVFDFALPPVVGP